MGYPIISNLTIRQGSTFSKVFSWGTKPYVYKAITSVSLTAPCVLVVPSHSLVDGWPINISGVKGTKELNAKNNPPSIDDTVLATVRDSNTLELNDVDASAYSAYQSGGFVRYATPVTLSGFTARMQIREKLKSTSTIDSLTTENSKIVLDDSSKTITLVLDAATTAEYSFKRAVYDLEMIDSMGAVTPLVSGSIFLEKEVTR